MSLRSDDDGARHQWREAAALFFATLIVTWGEPPFTKGAKHQNDDNHYGADNDDA